MKCQHYQWIPVEGLEPFVLDDHWVMEQKLDGVRALIHVTDGNVRWEKGDGELLTFAAAAQHFARWDAVLKNLPTCVIDAELLLTGELVMFDLPYLRGLIEPTNPLFERRAALETLGRHTGLTVVVQAKSTREKLRLWNRVEQLGLEGVVLKRLDASYHVGRRTKDVLKVKRTHTVDAMVIRPNEGTQSVALGLWTADGELVEVGNCTTIGKGTFLGGEVVEVEFGHVANSENPSLYSPRIIRVREDKKAKACMVDQLTPAYVNREVLA